ncbi:MAG: hypothetical protein M1410_05250 [Candidatus Thermoplasmatota archaeon]|nr:hypothetical protein [Candidatus Thermoplasmatota archaeon]
MSDPDLPFKECFRVNKELNAIAPNATDVITMGKFAIRLGLTIKDIISTVHIFPSFSEGI